MTLGRNRLIGLQQLRAAADTKLDGGAAEVHANGGECLFVHEEEGQEGEGTCRLPTSRNPCKVKSASTTSISGSPPAIQAASPPVAMTRSRSGLPSSPRRASRM